MQQLAMQLKQAGQYRAANNSSEFIQHAIAEFRRWASPGESFRVEQFRDHCLAVGIAPESPAAWGSLPGILARRKLITWRGEYAPAHSPATHGHPVRVWVVL